MHRPLPPTPSRKGRGRSIDVDDRSSREGRPSPDALLQAAQQGRVVGLKIFLGAAPGVGKTYEMLSAARARQPGRRRCGRRRSGNPRPR